MSVTDSTNSNSITPQQKLILQDQADAEAMVAQEKQIGDQEETDALEFQFFGSSGNVAVTASSGAVSSDDEFAPPVNTIVPVSPMSLASQVSSPTSTSSANKVTGVGGK